MFAARKRRINETEVFTELMVCENRLLFQNIHISSLLYPEQQSVQWAPLIEWPYYALQLHNIRLRVYSKCTILVNIVVTFYILIFNFRFKFTISFTDTTHNLLSHMLTEAHICDIQQSSIFLLNSELVIVYVTQNISAKLGFTQVCVCELAIKSKNNEI